MPPWRRSPAGAEARRRRAVPFPLGLSAIATPHRQPSHDRCSLGPAPWVPCGQALQSADGVRAYAAPRARTETVKLVLRHLELEDLVFNRLAATTAGRRGEVAAIRWLDVDEGDASVTVPLPRPSEHRGPS